MSSVLPITNQASTKRRLSHTSRQ